MKYWRLLNATCKPNKGRNRWRHHWKCNYIDDIPRSLRMRSAVYLRQADRHDVRPTIRELLEQCRWRDVIAPNASVVIKPNLCTERVEQIHSANTSIGVL